MELQVIIAHSLICGRELDREISNKQPRESNNTEFRKETNFALIFAVIFPQIKFITKKMNDGSF